MDIPRENKEKILVYDSQTNKIEEAQNMKNHKTSVVLEKCKLKQFPFPFIKWVFLKSMILYVDVSARTGSFSNQF